MDNNEKSVFIKKGNVYKKKKLEAAETEEDRVLFGSFFHHRKERKHLKSSFFRTQIIL